MVDLDKYPDEVELFIADYFPQSLNRTQDRHWIHRHKRKQDLMNLLNAMCLQSGGVPHFYGHVKMSITRLWGKGQRAFDDENLWGGVKLLRDVMRQRKPSGKGWAGGLGIIEDDGPKQCLLTVGQGKNHVEAYKDLECTLIVIEGKLLK